MADRQMGCTAIPAIGTATLTGDRIFLPDEDDAEDKWGSCAIGLAQAQRVQKMRSEEGGEEVVLDAAEGVL